MTPFEIITVIKGIPRKNGKRPTVDGFASFASGYDENGPAFFINREKHSIQLSSGKWLKGTSPNDPIKNARWESRIDGSVDIHYDQELRFDRKAVRALFKIAVEVIAFFEGLDAARDKSLDAVKHFVLNGGGDFRAIMMPDRNTSYDSYFVPCFGREGHARVCGMTILGIGFLCDFDPTFAGGEMLLEAAKSESLSAQTIPNWPRELWMKNNFADQ